MVALFRNAVSLRPWGAGLRWSDQQKSNAAGGNPVAILQKQKAAPKSGLSILAVLTASYLVAGIGFEQVPLVTNLIQLAPFDFYSDKIDNAFI